MHRSKGLSVSIAFGHNASKWLAELLNRPKQGVVAYHELKFKHYRPWKRAFRDELEYGVDSDKFKAYWDVVNNEMKTHHVFDTNSWAGHTIPDLANLTYLYYVIYVTRNAIDWIYSVTLTSSYNKLMNNLDSFPMYGLPKAAWDKLGRPFKNNFDDFTAWERMCFSWAKSFYMPAWLESNIDQSVLVYKMEDLVSGDSAQDILRKFSIKLSNRKVRGIQKNNINRHLNDAQKKTTRQIWNSWDTEQKEAFKTICGEGMDYYGYEIY